MPYPTTPSASTPWRASLQAIQATGTDDLRMMLNAEGGSVHAALTASGAMFEMVRAIALNVPGTNMVTTVLEHPSSYDAMERYARETGRELRVAPSNPATGGVDVDAVVRLVDEGTTLLNVIYASNISGAKLDLERIVAAARAVKPDLYIVVDAVQHAPHGLIDLQKTPVDGINLAPYKFFGCRGSGLAWLSDRAAALPHHKLSAKPEGFWDLGRLLALAVRRGNRDRRLRLLAGLPGPEGTAGARRCAGRRRGCRRAAAPGPVRGRHRAHHAARTRPAGAPAGR